MSHALLGRSVAVRQAAMSLQQPSQVYGAAIRAASWFPNSEDVKMAIYELLFNAIEHGNLGIGYDNKSRLLHEGRLPEELARRLRDPRNRDKKVLVSLWDDGYECGIQIKDEGQGFNWRHYQLTSEVGYQPHGRGLQIVWRAPFDSLQFNDPGNSVSARMRW